MQALVYFDTGIRENARNGGGFMKNEYRYQKEGVSCGVLPFCPWKPGDGIKAGGSFPGCGRGRNAGVYLRDYSAMGMMWGPSGYLWEVMGW